MKHANIIDLVDYREQYIAEFPPRITKKPCSEELGDAIQHLIQRLRDRAPIEKAAS